MKERIDRLIAEGEHQQLDFKFRIDDARKIARTLVAFANTDGGRLLVGVKDNGKIAGVRSEEDFYVVEAAADMYSKPPVGFDFKSYTINGKKLIEIYIPPSANRPHKCSNDEGQLKAYYRSHDKNVLANGVMLKVWELGQRKRPPNWQYTDAEQELFRYLREYEEISLSKYCRMTGMKRRKAEASLARLVSWEILTMAISESGCRFRLSPSHM
jgi:predicted HTH transcriptional regulator